MEFVKDRSLAEGMKVRVYLNWNKGFSVFSIVDHKSGLVVAYSESVTLRNATFKVYKHGVEKCRQNKRKNVHAWVLGEFIAEQRRPLHLSERIFFDPYKCDQFVVDGTQEAILQADEVHCVSRRVWVSQRDSGNHSITMSICHFKIVSKARGSGCDQRWLPILIHSYNVIRSSL